MGSPRQLPVVAGKACGHLPREGDGQSLLVRNQRRVGGLSLGAEEPLRRPRGSPQGEEQTQKVCLFVDDLLKLINYPNISFFNCRGRKMNASLEKAIQEAMTELD